MNTNELLNKKIDIFKNAKNSDKPIFTTTLIDFHTKLTMKNKSYVDILRQLNQEDENKAKNYKKNYILCGTPSATFNERRVVGDIKEKTGIIAIDIDKDKNIGLDADKAKQDVMKLPYVFMTMKSCRGEGIFCYVYYNSDIYIKYVFNALKEDFNDIGYIIDDCSDITRLRFISYDENILIKREVERYEKYKNDEKIEYEDNGEPWILTKQDLKDLVCAVYVLVNYCDYCSDDYNDWLLDGFRLATIPNRDVGYKLFEMISQASDNYEGPDDTDKKFEECCRTTKYNTKILGYYINLVKEIFGKDWKKRINEIIKTKQRDKS